MNNQILTDQQVVYYVVRLNGQEISPRVETRAIAEMSLNQLPPETRALAEVVPVTADGRQLLLG